MSALLNLFIQTRKEREILNSMCTFAVLEVEKGSTGCGNIVLEYYSPYAKHSPGNAAAYVNFDPKEGNIVCFANYGLDNDTLKQIIYSVRDKICNKRLCFPDYALTDDKKALLEQIYSDGYAEKTTRLTPHGVVTDYCVV